MIPDPEMLERVKKRRDLTYILGQTDSSMGPVFQSAFDVLIAFGKINEEPTKLGLAIDSLDRQTRLHMNQDKRKLKVRETTYAFMESFVDMMKWTRKRDVGANFMRERMESALKAAHIPIPDCPTEIEILQSIRLLENQKEIKEEAQDDDIVMVMQSPPRKRRREDDGKTTSTWKEQAVHCRSKPESELARAYREKQRAMNLPWNETVTTAPVIVGAAGTFKVAGEAHIKRGEANIKRREGDVTLRKSIPESSAGSTVSSDKGKVSTAIDRKNTTPSSSVVTPASVNKDKQHPKIVPASVEKAKIASSIVPPVSAERIKVYPKRNLSREQKTSSPAASSSSSGRIIHPTSVAERVEMVNLLRLPNEEPKLVTEAMIESLASLASLLKMPRIPTELKDGEQGGNNQMERAQDASSFEELIFDQPQTDIIEATPIIPAEISPKSTIPTFTITFDMEQSSPASNQTSFPSPVESSDRNTATPSSGLCSTPGSAASTPQSSSAASSVPLYPNLVSTSPQPSLRDTSSLPPSASGSISASPNPSSTSPQLPGLGTLAPPPISDPSICYLHTSKSNRPMIMQIKREPVEDVDAPSSSQNEHASKSNRPRMMIKREPMEEADVPSSSQNERIVRRIIKREPLDEDSVPIAPSNFIPAPPNPSATTADNTNIKDKMHNRAASTSGQRARPESPGPSEKSSKAPATSIPLKEKEIKEEPLDEGSVPTVPSNPASVPSATTATNNTGRTETKDENAASTSALNAQYVSVGAAMPTGHQEIKEEDTSNDYSDEVKDNKDEIVKYSSKEMEEAMRAWKDKPLPTADPFVDLSPMEVDIKEELILDWSDEIQDKIKERQQIAARKEIYERTLASTDEPQLKQPRIVTDSQAENDRRIKELEDEFRKIREEEAENKRRMDGIVEEIEEESLEPPSEPEDGDDSEDEDYVPGSTRKSKGRKSGAKASAAAGTEDGPEIKCELCDVSFKREKYRKAHMRKKHGEQQEVKEQ